ncbi:WD repeat-containing protein 93 [Triplophysa rosa]|uniref:WD repeat-containing protein 93 n=1 Tax=Triplophysa rosa TaxID=992332 RepID=A0A9W7X692_TRIRA|nr:WD repeat-containing protein 93 [Triplophysa rosa]KAI7814778.1 putative WD repeat-containing protein 93 [Triplophysa rosa]
MALYSRKGLEIPEPSDCSSSEDDDITYLTDLYQPEHQLPESVRVSNKLLNSLVDRAWEVISKQDSIRKDAEGMRKVPVLNPKEMKLPGRTNSVVCSDDGVYLFLGHTHGLSVISTSTLTSVRTWQGEKVELTSISCASLENCTHLLCTVDDMGIARLFVHHKENIYLIKVLNETDDINQRNICTKFEVSRSGDFGAAVMTSGRSVWLDVYRFPRDLWLKELETKQATQTSGSTEAKLSPTVLLMKIKPPEIPAGTSLKSPSEVLQKTDGGTIIGSGQNHMISSSQWENQDAAFRKMFAKYLSSSPMTPSQQRSEGPSNCTFHFLLREGFCPLPGGAKPTRDIPIALCLWWSGSHNFLHYILKTSKEKTDGEPRPDVLWPNSQEILCSAVSACTRFIVLGLVSQLVTIWDRRFGCPYANIVIPGDSAICRLKFILQSAERQQVNTPLQQGPFSPKLQLVVTCRNGSCYSVTAGCGGDTPIVAFIERPADQGGFATVAEPVPFLKCLALLMQRDGQVSVWDTKDAAPVFILTLPQTHVLGPLWDPVYVLDAVQQNLYIRGDSKTHLKKVTDEEEDENSLFIFSFSQCSVMDLYRITWPAATEKETRVPLSGLEEACNLYIQERLDTLEERNRNLAIQWEQLQQRAVK